MSKNNYKPAIKAVIEARKTQGKLCELFLQVLSDSPAAIVAAWEKINLTDVDEKIIKMAKSGSSIIECIKFHRSQTDSGLRESKEHCEKLYRFKQY